VVYFFVGSALLVLAFLRDVGIAFLGEKMHFGILFRLFLEHVKQALRSQNNIFIFIFGFPFSTPLGVALTTYNLWIYISNPGLCVTSIEIFGGLTLKDCVWLFCLVLYMHANIKLQ
jgi:hypothetical protein